MKQIYSFIIAALALTASQNAMAQWKPTTCKYYESNSSDDDRYLTGKYLYAYDTSGNTTKLTYYNYDYDYSEGKLEGPFFDSELDMTYDTSNRLTGYLAKTDYDGTVKEVGSCTIAYDETNKDIITSFERTGDIMTIEDYAPTAYYRTLTRDANGNITKILISCDYNNKLTDIERVTVEYKDNKPVTFKEETKLYDPDAENLSETSIRSSWKTLFELTDIEWESTGKNFYLVMNDPFESYELATNMIVNPYRAYLEEPDETLDFMLADILEGDYRIKSATFKESMYGYTYTASLSATYESNGSYDLKLDVKWRKQSGLVKIKKTYTDDNGSFTYTNTSYEDGEMTDDYKLELTKNDHGNTIGTKVYENDGEGGELEYEEGEAIHYTYDDETGEIASITFDDEKYVYYDFIDVTKQTGIRSVKADRNEPTSVFDISGRKVGTSLDNLKSRKGLLIVKQGGKARKVMVK